MSASGVMVEIADDCPYGVVFTLQIDRVGEFDVRKRRWNNRRRMGLRFDDVHDEIYELVRATIRPQQETSPLKWVS